MTTRHCIQAIGTVCALSFALAPSPGFSQGAAQFSSEVSFLSGGTGACSATLRLVSTATMHGATVSVAPSAYSAISGRSVGAPMLAGSLVTPGRFRWQVAIGGAIGSANAACVTDSDKNRGWLSLSRSTTHGGFGLSAADRSFSSLDPARDQQGLTAYSWRDLGRVRVQFDVRRRGEAVDGWSYTTIPGRWTKFRPDSGFGREDSLQAPASRDSSWTRTRGSVVELRTRLRTAVGRLALDFTFGASRGGPASGLEARADSLSGHSSSRGVRVWGRGDARLTVSSFLELVGGLVSLPAAPMASAAPRHAGVLGVMLTGRPRGTHDDPSSTPAADESARASPFQVVHDSASTTRIRVRLPKASRVELSSELTGWTALDMHASGDGWWELPLSASPGSYRVNIRVDGGKWKAPPGAPTVKDEFGGAVGLLLID